MQTRQRSARTFFLTVVLPISCALGCNDPLPTYEQPKVSIETIIQQVIIDTVYYSESFEEVGPDSNLVFQIPNPVVFDVYEKSLYDETLYGKASVSGNLKIWITDQPEIKATVPISESNIVTGSGYDPKTGFLTVDPNGSVRFQISWNLRDNNGRFIYHDLTNFTTTPIDSVSFYRICSTKLHVRANLQLFPQTSTNIGDQDFTLNMKGRIVILEP